MQVAVITNLIARNQFEAIKASFPANNTKKQRVKIANEERNLPRGVRASQNKLRDSQKGQGAREQDRAVDERGGREAVENAGDGRNGAKSGGG
jgi:hypothetical protein